MHGKVAIDSECWYKRAVMGICESIDYSNVMVRKEHYITCCSVHFQHKLLGCHYNTTLIDKQGYSQIIA